MKMALATFLILTICNISFSQEKKSELPTENKYVEMPEEPVFKFHPNPVEDELFVIGTYKIKNIQIMNALGNVVAIYQFDKSIIRINVSELTPGIYLLKVIDKKDRVDVRKLVVK